MNLDKLNHDQNHDIKILGVNLSHFNSTIQFLLLATTVFVFHLTQAYFQELIFHLDGLKPFSIFFTLVQFAVYALLAVTESCVKYGRLKRRKLSIKTYLLIAFLTVATMGLSNTAVAYLNFPTFNMFKSCKLIPVMIGSMIILGKRYNKFDVCAVLLMCIGLILFTLADSQVQPNFQLFGVCVVLMALMADAVIGNVQEKAMKQHDSSNIEMVLYSYAIGFVYLLVVELLSGQLVSAMSFFSQYPKETYGYTIVFSIFGYFGLNVVLTLVRHYGALVTVTVTTCRKAITIVLSFILFTKPFTMLYFWSGLIVVAGIYLNLYSKNQQKWNRYLLICLNKIFTKKRSFEFKSNNNYIV